MVYRPSNREVGVKLTIGNSMTSENGSFCDCRISRRKLASVFLAGSIIAIVAVAILPLGTTTARPIFEGGGCDGCHIGAQTPAMLTVGGLPVGTYTPSLPYTIVITIDDTTVGTGENNFDIIASAGSFSTTDPNAEVNTPATGAEASAKDAVSPMTATSWTVVWTAPSSGSVQIDVWAVMGDGAVGSLDIWDHKSSTYSVIPEFSLVLIPVIGVVSILILVSRIRKG